MEFVELNPTLDHENKSGRLAVWLIESALGRMILYPGRCLPRGLRTRPLRPRWAPYRVHVDQIDEEVVLQRSF